MFVIADTHISSNKEYCELFDIIKILKKYDQVILLGDILDFTKIAHTDLNWLSDDFDDVIYIKGNHDIIADEIGIKCIDKYVTDKGLRFEHGHKFEAMLSSNFYIDMKDYCKVFRSLCYSKTNLNKIAHLLWDIKMKVAGGERKRDKLKMEILNEMCKIGNIICGHAHIEAKNTNRRALLLESYYEESSIYMINEDKFLKDGDYNVFKFDGDISKLETIICEYYK